MPQHVHLAALIGGGRSGTTWLGTMLSAHPEVDYRFEPITKMEQAGGTLAEWKARFGHTSTDEVDLDEVLEKVEPGSTFSVKPPFFPPGPIRGPVRGIAWLAARRIPKVRRLHEWASRSAGRVLLFKEVDEIPLMETLLGLNVPVVFLMRDPRAVVASRLHGQQSGFMPDQRRRHIHNVLGRRAPHLLDLHQHELDDLGPAAREALLWRADNDRGLAAVDASPHGHAVYYEEIVADPMPKVGGMLEHLGLSMTDDVESFIEATMDGPRLRTRLRYGEVGVKPYFSVFRHPSESIDRWQQTLDDEQQADVLRLVAGSPAYLSGRGRGLWHADSSAADPASALDLEPLDKTG